MNKIYYSFTLFTVISQIFSSDQIEYIAPHNVSIVVKQVVNGFFGSRYSYSEKTSCLNGALTEVEKCKNLGYPRHCIKEKTLERILRNIKNKSMELARSFERYHPRIDQITEAIGRKVYSKLIDIIGYNNSHYVDAFEKFITDHPLSSYSFEDKIRRMVEEEKKYYVTLQPKPTCSVAYCEAQPHQLIQFACKHYICINDLLEWNSAQTDHGKMFRCPKCGLLISTFELQKLINSYYETH